MFRAHQFPISRWMFASPPSSAGFGMFGLWVSRSPRLDRNSAACVTLSHQTESRQRVSPTAASKVVISMRTVSSVTTSKISMVMIRLGERQRAPATLRVDRAT